ncbi:MAG: endonuclease III [Campylobacterales bacterium]
MKRRTKAQIEELRRRFLERYGKATTELCYNSPYELLVAIILSAQCTDKRVNLITPALFERCPTIEALAQADINEVKKLISTCSFFNNKAQHLVAMAKQVVLDHGGVIPTTEKELIRLSGVGEKTARVFLIELFGANTMAVDTHVFRTSHRLGLSRALTPSQTADDLTKLFKTDLHTLHQGLVLFGRYICKAQKPLCEACFVRDFCTTTANFKPR